MRVSGNGNAVQFQDPISSDAAACTSISGRLAILMLESEELQKQRHQEQLGQARADYTAQVAAEVQALRDKADAAHTGALMSAGLAVGGSAFGAWGATTKAASNSWQAKVGEGAFRLSGPLGELAGSTQADAEAKVASGQQTQALWAVDDAKDGVKSADESSEKVLDWLGSMVDRDAATMAAILANKA